MKTLGWVFLCLIGPQLVEVTLYLLPRLDKLTSVLAAIGLPSLSLVLWNLLSPSTSPSYYTTEDTWAVVGGAIAVAAGAYFLLRFRASSLFPPLRIPIRRRLQTMCTIITWPMSLWGNVLVVILLLASWWTRWLIVVYLACISLLDKTPARGGWKIKKRHWLYELNGKLCCEFFPVSLVKTTDLAPDASYIFGYHPHGILSLGAWCNFCTDGTGFSGLFPGLESHLLTLRQCFWIPLFRQLLLYGGAQDVSRSTLVKVASTPGQVAVVIVGGAQEALDTSPGTLDLTIKQRKGFVRVALETGASLVPVVSFGENDLFWTAVGVGSGQDGKPVSRGEGMLRRVQQVLKKAMGYSLPIFIGRGLLQYKFGLLPYRHPIVSVVGKPLPVGKKLVRPAKDAPEDEKERYAKAVDDLHSKYMEEVQSIYDKFKDKYAPDRVRDMVFK